MVRSLIMESIKGKIDLQKKDITTLKVDAIVNAANEKLLGGGGVDGAIHRAAGRQLLEECRKLNGCQTGKAKITSGYNLPAKFVIHTVGPFGEHPKLLESCYKNSLDLLKEKNLRTIAFPCISTGIYRYPNQNAAEVAFETVYNWIKDNPGSIERVTFCLFLDDDEKIYKQLLKKYFPENDGSSVDGEGYRKRNQKKVKSDKTKQGKKGEKSGKSFLTRVLFSGSEKEKNPKGKETAPESHPGKATQSNKSVHTAVNKDSHHQAKNPVVHDKEANMENTKLKGENVKGNSKEQRMPDRGEEEMEDTSNPQKRVKDDAIAGDGKPTDELQKPTELNDNSPESDKNDLGSDTKEKDESIDV